MKCDHIKEKIDSLVFELNDKTNPEVHVHIGNCDLCKRYYEESLLSKKVINHLRNQNHPLKNPEILTNTILNSIKNLDKADPASKVPFASTLIKFKTIQHLLAAASVLLLLTFGYEQFIVIDKVLALEKKMSTSTQKARRIKNYNELITFYPTLVTQSFIVSMKEEIKKKESNKLRSKIMLARINKMDITRHKHLLPNQSNEKESNSRSVNKKEKRGELYDTP